MHSLRAILLLLVLLGVADILSAAEPDLRIVNLRGLQIGATTTLVIDGDGLGKTPSLLLPFPAKVALKAGNTDTKATFDITPEEGVTPGCHHLRIVTEGGVSLPAVVAVDRLPQKTFGPVIEALPVALHGSTSGSVTVETKFAGKKGTKIRVEVEAQRLGSKLRPVVHLVGPSKREVAWSWPNPALDGDTRLDATLSEEGEHAIRLHDSEYAGANPGFFRLLVGTWSSVEQVFPPVIGPARQTVTAITNHGVEKLEATPTPGASVVPLPWPTGKDWSGPRPFVRVSSRPEVIEQSNADRGQPVPEGPVGVSGKLLTPYEEDRYVVPVKAGQKLRLEVESERLGSPLDVALIVRNPMGNEIARGEESPNSLDPILDYTVPANVTSIIVGVLDAQGRAGPRGIYRLTITPQSASKGGLQLLTATQRLSVPAGGIVVHHVGIERDGYDGPIELSADGLPAGVTAENTTIPAGADGTLVTLRRTDAASASGITTWRGKTTTGEQGLLVVKGHPLERLQPWLANEIAIAPTRDRATDFAIDYRGLPTDAALKPASKLALPFKLTRPMGKSVVRVTLLTSQLGPLATPPENPNTLLRLERAIEVPATASEGEASVIVPPTLTAPVCDLTLRAELLSANKQQVLATAFAPVRRLPLRLPLALETTMPRVVAKRDAKANVTVEITGKLDRRDGVKGDVQLTLTGLPSGVPGVPVTTIKADASTFALKLTIPPSLAPGETALKLSGTIVPDPKQANVRVRSRELGYTLAVQ